jgi:two-component system sensor histidine kinase YesM
VAALYKIIIENKFYLKLMLTYCLIIFLGLGLTSYLVTSNMIDILTEMESRFDSEVIQKVKNYSDDRYQDVKSIFVHLYQKEYFNKNTSIVDFINPMKEAQRNNSYKSGAILSYLQDTCSANTAITDILLIDYSGREIFFCSNIHNRDVSIDYDFFQYDFLGSGEIRNKIEIVPNYIPDYINSSSVNNFQVISYRIFLFDENSIRFNKPLGMAVVNMRADLFKTAYKDSSSFKGNIYVINSDGLTLFDSSGSLSGQFFPYITYSASGLNDLETNKKSIVNKRYSEETGFAFVDIVDKRIIAKETDGIRANINNIIAVCIALTMAIGLISASILSKRIKSLVKNMKDVESGKLDTHIMVGSNDEIGYLEQSFNTMCAKLTEYIKNVYVFEIKTKTAELKALQAQIDPHFLFNTLESIRITAQLNKDFQTAKMIHLLGNMFRWNIKMKGIIVDLKEEIDYVRSYIELQKLRYNNAFDVTFSIDSSAYKLGVLKLTIQPIVENAIAHGMGEKQAGGHILIEGLLSEGKLVLRISDNGKGMDENKVSQVTASLTQNHDQDKSGSIGLSNVHQRNCILFGDDYGLKIFSELGKGTDIEISLPIMSKEEMERYVQGGNC